MDDDIHRLPDKVQIREDTPEDLKVAIETFFEATKMIKEGYVEKMPGEYVANLIEVLDRYPEWKKLARELTRMVMTGVDNDV
jgi:adenylate kinase family enzyme